VAIVIGNEQYLCHTSNLTFFFKHIRNRINLNRDFWEGARGLGSQPNHD
jgi:hypothetical protein